MRHLTALLLAALAAVLLTIGRGEEAAAQEGAVHLPVLMYHSVLKAPSRQGRYTITPAQRHRRPPAVGGGLPRHLQLWDKVARLAPNSPEGLYNICRLLRMGNRSLARILAG